jgi:hypothetical protein
MKRFRYVIYFVRGTGLLAEESRWGRGIDQKMVAVQGSPFAPTLLIPIRAATSMDIGCSCSIKILAIGNK